MRISLDRRAAQELRKARLWYRVHNRQAEAGLREAYADARAVLRGNPNTGVAIDGGLRRSVVRGYPFVLIYQVREREIHIIAIAHTSREPDYWRNRLNQ